MKSRKIKKKSDRYAHRNCVARTDEAGFRDALDFETKQTRKPEEENRETDTDTASERKCVSKEKETTRGSRFANELTGDGAVDGKDGGDFPGASRTLAGEFTRGPDWREERGGS